MGKVFKYQTVFNPNPGKYSYENWNQAAASNDPREMRNVEYMVKGNFETFMYTLLGYAYTRDAGEWMWVKEKESWYDR